MGGGGGVAAVGAPPAGGRILLPAEAAQRDRNVEAGVDVLRPVVIVDVLVGEGAGVDGKRAAAAAFDDGALHIRIAGHIERGAAGAVDRGQVVGPGLVLGAAHIGEADAAGVLERSMPLPALVSEPGPALPKGPPLARKLPALLNMAPVSLRKVGVGGVAARPRGGRHAAEPDADAEAEPGLAVARGERILPAFDGEVAAHIGGDRAAGDRCARHGGIASRLQRHRAARELRHDIGDLVHGAVAGLEANAGVPRQRKPRQAHAGGDPDARTFRLEGSLLVDRRERGLDGEVVGRGDRKAAPGLAHRALDVHIVAGGDRDVVTRHPVARMRQVLGQARLRGGVREADAGADRDELPEDQVGGGLDELQRLGGLGDILVRGAALARIEGLGRVLEGLDRRGDILVGREREADLRGALAARCRVGVVGGRQVDVAARIRRKVAEPPRSRLAS